MIALLCVVIICWYVDNWVEACLEQRRRETKTGEFEE